MSSDSEEDFLSADEGSDYDIPKEKFVITDHVRDCPNYSAISVLDTDDQSSLKTTEESDISAEYVHVKFPLFDKDVVIPPSSINVVSPHSTEMKNTRKNVITPSDSNIKEELNEQLNLISLAKNVEGMSSCLDKMKVINTKQNLEESSKPESNCETAEVIDSPSHSNLSDDTPETRALLQATLEGALDPIPNLHIDSKLSSVNDSAENSDTSKSCLSCINVAGEPELDAPALQVDQSDASSSFDQYFNISKLDLHTTGDAFHLHSSVSKLDSHSTGNKSNSYLTEKETDLYSTDNKPDLHSSENIPDLHHTGSKHDVPSGDSKLDQFLTKPRKTSKIGLKKPREKLGERMGKKKIGSKVHKPLESISCDSLKSQSTIQVEEMQSIENFSSETDEGQHACDDASGKDKKVEDESSWGSAWGGWGTTLLSAASTLTQEVGRGVGSVVELVEDGIGVPSPEELAKEQREQQLVRELEIPDAWQENWSQSDGGSTSNKEPYGSLATDQTSMTDVSSLAASSNNASTPGSGSSTHAASSMSGAFTGLSLGRFSSLVSGVSGALETAGSKVVFGGLDTLELIGRRTMDVLQESDPNLRSRKDRLLQRVNKPNLAVVLREAREKAVANPAPDNGGDFPISPTSGQSSRVTFVGLWDNSTGPAHLEALALIARQCASNSRTLQASLPPALRREADCAVKEMMALSEIDEENLTESSIFSERVAATIRELGLPLNADNIAQCWSDLSSISDQYSEGSSSLSEETLDGRTVQSNVVGSCVLLVERLVAVAHKAAELCLTTPHDEIEPTRLATQYRELVVLGGSQLESCADAVCTGLSSTPQQEKLTPTITNIYMQVCEGSSCLQQSLVHLCTTLQLVQLQRIGDLRT